MVQGQVLLSHVSFQTLEVFYNGFYHQGLFGDLEIEATNSKTQVIWCMSKQTGVRH